MRNDCRIGFLLCLAVTTSGLGGISSAQEPSEPAAEPLEVVVTARKREENIQQVPLAVTAIDAESLEALGVVQTDDIAALAPNLYITQTAGSAANVAVSIRGVGGADPLVTRDGPVPIYLDGVYVARRAGAIFDLLDLERVEVLRGPQGTLYGRNATGGAINFISRRPTENFGLSQELSFGNFDHFTTKTTIHSGRLADSGLAASLTYLNKQRDGTVDDSNASGRMDPGAYEIDAFRFALEWAPGEKFAALYAFDYSDLDGQDPYFQVMEIHPAVLAALNPIGTIPVGRHARLDNVTEDFHKSSKHRVRGHSLTLTADLGFATLKSITAYRKWHNNDLGTEFDGHANLIANFPGSPVVELFSVTNERGQDQFSEELQLLGDLGQRLSYVTGIYYFEEQFDWNNPQQFLVTNRTSSAIPPGLGVPAAALLQFEGANESWALFGNTTWTPPILDDKLELTAGVRYSRDDREFAQQSPVVRANQQDFSNVDWVLEAAYEWTEDVNAYARIATGYLSGGFNPRAGPNVPFGEEKLLAYELGIKSDLLADRLRLNAAVFYSDYTDLQIDQFTAGSGGATSFTTNAGKAGILGVEVEASALITDSLRAYFNYGFLDADYKEFLLRNPTTNALVDVSNEAHFPFVPKHTLAAGLEFLSRPFKSTDVVLSGRVDARYVEDIWFFAVRDVQGVLITPFNNEIMEDNYALVDVGITFSNIPVTSQSALKLTLWGRNITDTSYRKQGVDFGAIGFAGASYGEPATYGFTMTIEY